MQYEISVRESQPQIVLMRHVVVDEVDLGSTIGATFDEVYGYFGRVGIQPAGPPFVVYHHGPDGHQWDADICAPAVRMTPEPPEPFEFTTIAGGLVATTIHRGPYDTIAPAYGAVSDWAAAHGYEFTGPPREVYLSEPDVVPDEIETMIEWPVELARVPAAV